MTDEPGFGTETHSTVEEHELAGAEIEDAYAAHVERLHAQQAQNDGPVMATMTIPVTDMLALREFLYGIIKDLPAGTLPNSAIQKWNEIMRAMDRAVTDARRASE